MIFQVSLLLHSKDIVSRVENIEWKSNMTMPRIEDSIYVDIETDIGGNEVWMIGLLYQGEVTQFTSMNKKEENKILDQFSLYLESLPTKPLVCYSRTNFDFRILWKAAKRTKNKNLLESMNNRAWLDFCTILGRSCRPPQGSLALKHVATYFGYPLKHGDYDGLKLSLEYLRRREKYGSISQSFLKVAEEYNEDDIKIMPYLLGLFDENVNYSQEFTKKCSNGFVKQLRKLIKDRKINYDIKLDQRGKIKLVRLRCDIDNQDKLYPRVLAAGLPLPLVYQGKNTTNLTWSSQLARERAAVVITDLLFREI